MRMRTWAALAMAVLLLAALPLAGCANNPGDRVEPQKGLVVNVIDVGQGDAILIRTPGQQVTLVDTGDVPARDKLLAYIKKQGITTIDNLIITHPHADHIGGAAAVFDNLQVKRVYDSGQTATSALYRQYLSLVKKKGIAFTVLTAGDQVDIGGGAALKILGPQKPLITGTDSDLNNNSVVARLTYGDFAMLLTGDAEKEAESAIVQKYKGQLKSQVLKSGHHGSKTSSSLEFLRAVSPEAAVISLGAGNDYKHPHQVVLNRYADLKIKVSRTDQQGTVTVMSDGKTYTITGEK